MMVQIKNQRNFYLMGRINTGGSSSFCSRSYLLNSSLYDTSICLIPLSLIIPLMLKEAEFVSITNLCFI